MSTNDRSNGVKLQEDVEEDQTGLSSLSAFSDDSERFDDVLKGRFLELELERKIFWLIIMSCPKQTH